MRTGQKKKVSDYGVGRVRGTGEAIWPTCSTIRARLSTCRRAHSHKECRIAIEMIEDEDETDYYLYFTYSRYKLKYSRFDVTRLF